MLRPTILKSFAALAFIVILSSCTKEHASNTESPVAIESANANVTTACNYVFDPNNQTGWNQLFFDDFNESPLTSNKWSIWTGGAFNNELQHYQASNLTVSNGILSITARKEKVTGKTDPWSTRLKTFSYTSGRIETKTLFSASTATPKIRMIARIQLP
jgi:hypothetical protein